MSGTVLPIILIPAGALLATCARCNLSRPDDGRRFKIHRGRAFICAACKPDRGGR